MVKSTRIGLRVFGVASVFAGVLDAVWREFEPAHQPIQAWGDHIPGITVLAYFAAACLIVGGTAAMWQKTERWGLAILAIVYGIFVLFPLPRLYTAPHYLGHHAGIYIGVLAGVGQQLILFVPAALQWACARGPSSPAVAGTARWVFGLCSIDFGLTHLVAVQTVAPMVPRWMPMGGAFWVVFTGAAFILAGLAIIARVQDVLAAWLLGTMLLVFSGLVLTPGIFAAPHNHVAWGGNAYNLTAVGASWMMAEWLRGRTAFGARRSASAKNR